MHTVVQLKPRVREHFMNNVDPSRNAETTCASCNLRELCLPGGLCIDDRLKNASPNRCSG